MAAFIPEGCTRGVPDSQCVHVSFLSPSGDAEVYVLYDMSGGEATRLPDWIEAEGFAKVSGRTTDSV